MGYITHIGGEICVCVCIYNLRALTSFVGTLAAVLRLVDNYGILLTSIAHHQPYPTS